MMEFVLLILIAALVYFIVAYLLRDAPVRRVRIRGAEHDPDLRAPRTRRAFEVLGSFSLQPGHRVEVFECGDALFPRLMDDLRSARSLIIWQVFWFKPGDLARQVGEILMERSRAGVDVLVLLDYFGAKGLDSDYLHALRESGIKVEVYRPLNWRNLYKVPHRSHVRTVVIDGKVGYTGGFGIDDQWSGDGRSPGQWRDTHVRISGPAVDQLQAPFIANWAEATGDLLYGDAVMEGRPGSADGQEAGIMYASPSLGSTNAERYVALTLFAAADTLYITSAYFVPPRGFRRLLKDAVSRGVDVRILHPGGNSDHPVTWYAGRASYEELLSAGVRIFEYEPTMVHAKTIVADGLWASVGSINFDNRSLKLNDEVTFVTRDAAFGRKMHEMFLRDLTFAREVKLETFLRRPRRERAREQLARLASPLM